LQKSELFVGFSSVNIFYAAYRLRFLGNLFNVHPLAAEFLRYGAPPIFTTNI